MSLSFFSENKNILIAGVDEAGRGPLCGDVFAAAVILSPDMPTLSLNDSKKLTEKKRRQLAIMIKDQAQAWAIASASVAEIDSFNILQATFLAMRRAIDSLAIRPEKAIIDGNQDPKLPVPTELIVKGDALYLEIAAASILAKTARDETMYLLDEQYPQYGFAQHKGYGTKKHLEALKMYGPLSVHRASFAPVAKLLEQ